MTVSSESKVGIVLVSHSAKLAEAVAELAKQMTQERVPIAIAAGIDDPENPFGTDVLKVQEAIESVYTDAGVVIFMDLGSAIMSAEMAVELLPLAQKNYIKICPAPLIEGAIAAIIQASLGANIQQVIAEANGALMTKSSQLNVDEAIPINIENTQNKDDETPSEKIKITVKNSLGIHARPAAKLVAIANDFYAKISLQNLTKNSHIVNAKSINQVMKLAVKKGDEIEIQATGNKAVDALKAIQELITNNFYQAEVIVKKTPKILTTPDTNNKLVGTPASPGVAIGNVVHDRAEILEEVEDYPVENSEAEWQYLQLMLQTAKQEIQRIIDSLSDQNKSENNQADIFQAHQLYIEDPTLLEQVHQLIFEQNCCAAVAWKTAIEEMIATYQQLEDPYLQGRAIDIKDVGGRVLQLLTGTNRISLNLSQPGILVAPDLTPSQATQLQPNLVLGICTSAGSVTAHSTLIANMLGIPMVVGVGSQLLSLTPGSQIALDGETGEIWLEPNQSQLQELQAKQAHTSSTFQQTQEAITQDGKKIPLMANILGVADTELALERGAEGVGLLRTEFLYLERNTAPTEAEEYETYRAIAEILGTRPLTIRTLDIGGDKVLPYIKQESEANPVLGCRGIRESLDTPDILRSQLRAILRVSHGHNIKVMFPMVTSLQEVRAAKNILTEVEHSLLELPSFPGVGNIKVGIMIEVPAAATMADQLAQEVDFFSIGTNDLSQYVMAADRTNSKVAHLADGLEPAVLRMIQQTVIAAHQASISVSVCGQLASSPLAVPILLGLGVDELSVAPPAISMVKKVISQLNGSQIEAIARYVLQLDGAKSVKEYIVGQLGLVIV